MVDTRPQKAMRRLHESALKAKKLLYNNMTHAIYFISAVMIVFWICGFFFFHAGWMIHIMPVLAVAAIILRATEKPRAGKKIQEN